MLWGIRPVEQRAAYGLAVDGLRRQIHLGLVMPGERLPAERQLAEQLAVSRVTLRQALRILETEGYLTVRRGVAGGAFIVGEQELRDLATRRMARDPAAVMRAFEFLLFNARIAARFAAIRRTPAHLKRMRRAVADLAQAEPPSSVRRAQTHLHMAIAEATQNVLLLRAIEDAWAETFLPMPANDAQAQRTTLQKMACELTDAIAARNEDRSEIAMIGILECDINQARLIGQRR